MKENYKNLEIYKCFKNSSLLSSKNNIYFDMYNFLFEKYRNKKITFVEVGVKWGGSLLMWKKFFGNQARIIGIDFYPETKKLEKYGFEIFIGDQSSELFWKNFFLKVGKIDILLDDGGHTNENQIITLNSAIQHVNDDGLIVIEDTSASFSKKHFNPSKYSFINYSKFLIDDLYGRCPKDKDLGNIIYKKKSLKENIYSIMFFNSIVAFFIDRTKCINKENLMNHDLEETKSEIIKDDFINPRWNSEIFNNGFINKIFFIISKTFFFIKKINILRNFFRFIQNKYFSIRMSQKNKKYFE
jgi:hypothetical protein